MTATDTSTVVLGDAAYTHDANGNLTGDATFIYQYDTANQLTNVIRKSDSAVVLQCRYDALGRRVEAIRADGTVDRYVYFPGSFLVLAVLDETNAPKEFYTRGPDLSGSLSGAGGISGILACTYSVYPSSPLFHHADIQGNIISHTASTGLLLSVFRYTPFGQLISCTGLPNSRYFFSSKEWDSEPNLVYYGSRHYSPRHAMWVTRDIVGEQGNPGLYGFLGNSCIDWIDFWGLIPEGVQRYSNQARAAGRYVIQRGRGAVKRAKKRGKEYLHEAEQHISDSITEEAERLYNYLQTHELDDAETAQLNATISVMRPAVKLAIDLEAKTMEWDDLAMAWFWELGNSSYLFSDGDWTTEQLKDHEGVNQAREKAQRECIPNQQHTIPHTWIYGRREFWTSLKEVDSAAIFLGSYSVTVVADGCCKFDFTVKNTSSWESATRFRKGASPGGQHRGIIQNHPRNAPGHLHLGGNMSQTWSWSEYQGGMQ